MVTPEEGAELASPSGEVNLTIPAGAVREPVFVVLQQVTTEAAPPPPSDFDLRVAVEISLRDADGNPLFDVLLAREATIAVGLAGGDLSAFGEDSILIQRYEPLLGQWISLPTTVDTAKKVATAMVTRLDTFALTLRQPSAAPAPTILATTVPAPTATPAAGPTLAPPTPASQVAPSPPPTPTAIPPATPTPLAAPTPVLGLTLAEDNGLDTLTWLLIVILAAIAATLFGGAVVYLAARRRY